ncbi:MAG: hypothetical protein WBR09_07715 [Serratia proteamaculans]
MAVDSYRCRWSPTFLLEFSAAYSNTHSGNSQTGNRENRSFILVSFKNFIKNQNKIKKPPADNGQGNQVGTADDFACALRSTRMGAQECAIKNAKSSILCYFNQKSIIIFTGIQ